MRPRVIDTSLLYAVAHERDVHHERARELLAEEGPCVIPNEVLIETLGVLTGRVGRQASRRFHEELQAIDGIEIGHETDMTASYDLLYNFPDLSIVDACAITLAWRLGCDLDTFDERQAHVWQTRA